MRSASTLPNYSLPLSPHKVADQAEFRLGPVGAIDGGRIVCQGCGYDIPPGARICPICGFERAPYPAGTFQRFDWAFDLRILRADKAGKPQTDPLAKFVLLALVSHDKPNGRGIFPSLDRLVGMTGLSRRAVIDALARLECGGWIAREKTRRRGRQGSNRYAIGPQYRVQQMHPDRVQVAHPNSPLTKSALDTSGLV